MSASSTRVALAAVAVLLISTLAFLGWRLATAPHTDGPGAQNPQRVAASADKDAHAQVAHAQHAPASVAPPSVGPASVAPASVAPASGEAISTSHASAPTAAARADNAPGLSLQRGRSEAEASEPPVAAAAPQPGAKEAPSFDIVRVEPNGDALLAGRSQPEADVALVAGGKVVARAKADTSGSFVMTPPTLRPGDYALSLREGDGAQARESKQSVVVSVPKSKQQEVVVALAEPGRPTRVLSAPPAAKTEPTPQPAGPAALAATAPKLAIRSVELENGSGLLASGTAPPGTGVRVYLNNSRVADVTAPADGTWSLTVRRGLAGGHYAVRADSLKPNRSVVSRVEVPFDVPTTMSAAPASSGNKEKSEVPPGDVHAAAGSVADAQPIAPPAVVSPSAAVVDDLKTTLVSRGDNLWRISRKQFGRGKRYTQIYAANAAQIRDPALIYPGQVFVLPAP